MPLNYFAALRIINFFFIARKILVWIASQNIDFKYFSHIHSYDTELNLGLPYYDFDLSSSSKKIGFYDCIEILEHAIYWYYLKLFDFKNN